MMKIFVVLGVLCSLALADLPVDCRYNEIVGEWNFYETTRNGSQSEDCDNLPIDSEFDHSKLVELKYPNIASDEFGNIGTWTMIYDQGFEVRIAGRSYFAFSYYENKTSFCDKTFPGWSRDLTVRNWSCFKARKTSPVPPKPFHELLKSSKTKTRREYDELVIKINAHQTKWTAKRHSNLKTIEKSLRRTRTYKPKDTPKPRTNFLTKAKARNMPVSWDWRNVSGINYVRPVRDQGNCGSCYAFASAEAVESQVLIRSNATDQIDLSPQDVIGCSNLAQGCDGGFPYLIAGRYGQDAGFVEEKCSPYLADDDKCSDRSHCRKVYITEYDYVGGYYGACNEEEMIVALIEDGPLPVGIMVYDDFMTYKSGVYHHTEYSLSKFEPFEITNHAVLLVGYGQTEEGEKYWIIKNSWGKSWGNNGYVYVRRGTDEIGVESMALRVIAYP